MPAYFPHIVGKLDYNTWKLRARLLPDYLTLLIHRGSWNNMEGTWILLPREFKQISPYEKQADHQGAATAQKAAAIYGQRHSSFGMLRIFSPMSNVATNRLGPRWSFAWRKVVAQGTITIRIRIDRSMACTLARIKGSRVFLRKFSIAFITTQSRAQSGTRCCCRSNIWYCLFDWRYRYCRNDGCGGYICKQNRMVNS